MKTLSPRERVSLRIGQVIQDKESIHGVLSWKFKGTGQGSPGPCLAAPRILSHFPQAVQHPESHGTALLPRLS